MRLHPFHTNAIQIKQRDNTDCAAACLASIAAWYKLYMPLPRIRQWAGTDSRGTSILGITEAAEKMRFKVKAIRASAEHLPVLPSPAIVHTKNAEGWLHFMVVLSVKRNKMLLMDPADGKIHKTSIADFILKWTGIAILLEPGPEFKTEKKKKGYIRKFIHLASPQMALLFTALLAAILHTLLGLSFSLYIQRIVDVVLARSQWSLLNQMGRWMLVILVIQFALGYGQSIIMLKTGRQTDQKLVMGYYGHLLKLPQSFFDSMKMGEIISRVNDAVKIRVFINDLSIRLVIDLVIIMSSFGIMFFYNRKLALIFSILLPLFVFLFFIQNRINKKWQRITMEKAAGLETQLVESISALSTIKRLALEQTAYSKTKNRLRALGHTLFESNRKSLSVFLFSETLSRLCILLLLWFGAEMVLRKELTAGELLSFYALAAYLINPAISLIYTNKSIQDAMIAADRLFEIMDLEPEKLVAAQCDAPALKGDINFSGIQFGYLNRKPVLKNLEFSISENTISAIVGESGSGKTTLLCLLQGIYPLQEGNIFIGGKSIQEIGSGNLRKRISVVPQRVDLFSATIRENITIGEEKPDYGCMMEICDLLGIDEFVGKLPEKYETIISEQGLNLSAGQKQKLGIARALYRKPDILILDEATSAMDAISARKVQYALDWFREQGKTVLFITHRLANIRLCDEIFVLKDGLLQDRGTHEHLFSNNAYYASLCTDWQ